MDYYRTAIRQIRLKIPNVKFFFFSDDPYWVEKKFNEEFGPIELVNHNFGINSANDMRLMSNCNHHIIANSSFSWWGAWLNPNPAKIVIAPKKWFLKEADNIDLIPKSWMRI